MLLGYGLLLVSEHGAGPSSGPGCGPWRLQGSHPGHSAAGGTAHGHGGQAQGGQGDEHPKPEGEDTLLRGYLPDQAALYGVIARLEALGLELVELRCVQG